MKQSIVFLLGILFIVLIFATLRKSREGMGDPFAFIKKPIAQIKALFCYLGELFAWMKTATDCIGNFFIYLLPCMFMYAIQLFIILSLSPIIIFIFLIEFAMSKSNKKYEPFVYKKIVDNVRLIPGVNTMCYRCNIPPPKTVKGKKQKDKLQFPVYPKI
jgi:hypothetical protein